MRHDCTVLADHYQFHCCDCQEAYAFPDEWPAPALADRVLVAAGTLGVATTKPHFVPVTIELAETEPMIEDEAWDHIVAVDLALPSGRLVLCGGPSPTREAQTISVAAGGYRALVLSGNLDRSAPDAVGDDYYKIMLWPAPPSGMQVRKRWVAAAD